MIFRVLVLAIVLLTVSAANIFAQSNGADASKRSPNERGRDDDAAPSEGMLEMQFRWRTRAAEKEFNEMIGRSDDVRETSAAIKTGFEQNKSLAAADLAKLPNLEKQLKKIRKSLGGDDDDDATAEVNPVSLAEALDKLAEIAAALNEDLKKSTRYQVSAASIEDANQMLDLIAYIRANAR